MTNDFIDKVVLCLLPMLRESVTSLFDSGLRTYVDEREDCLASKHAIFLELERCGLLIRQHETRLGCVTWMLATDSARVT